MKTPSAKTWITTQKSRWHAAHVRPVDDVIEHTDDGECICRPRYAFQKCGGPDDIATVLVHHSMDGREQAELEG